MSWGRQAFLNAPGHEDNGFIIAHISERSNRRWRGVFGNLTVADCDRRSHLDFSTIDLLVDGTSSKHDCDAALVSIRQRRAKVKILRNIVNAFCDKMDSRLDDYEIYVKAYRKDAVDRD